MPRKASWDVDGKVNYLHQPKESMKTKITPTFRVARRKVLTGNIIVLENRKQIDGSMSFVIHDFYGHIYVLI